METQYHTVCYDRKPSFRLHHITGSSPEDTMLLPQHYDTDVALAYFRQGGGSVRIEGRYYPIGAGDVILLNPRELHCFTFRSGIQDRVVLYLREDIIRAFPCGDPGFFDVFYSRPEGKGNHILAEEAERRGITALLEQILKLSCGEDGWSHLLAICRIVELVDAVRKFCNDCTQSKEFLSVENETVQDVLRYIGENLSSLQNSDQIAQKFFLHKAYLCRLFKATVGISLWNYVIFRRLQHSNDLIRGGESAEEACYRSGFQNYSNYFRLYKKYFGESPSGSIKNGR